MDIEEFLDLKKMVYEAAISREYEELAQTPNLVSTRVNGED